MEGTSNELQNNSVLTVGSGSTLTAEAGSVVDLSDADVALPAGLAIENLALTGVTNFVGDGATFSLLKGATWNANAGSTVDLSQGSVTLPPDVILAASSQSLFNKTLFSPTIDSISAPPLTDLTLRGGPAGSSITLGQGPNGNLTFAPSGDGLVMFLAKPGSLGGGGVGPAITDDPIANPVGLNGFLRVGRGQAVVTRNGGNTGDHILLSSNSNLTDDTALGDGDYRTVLLGASVFVMGSPAGINRPMLNFGNAEPNQSAIIGGGTTLQFRIGDNSGDAAITAGTATFSSPSSVTVTSGPSSFSTVSSSPGAVSEFITAGNDSAGFAHQFNFGINRFATNAWSLSSPAAELLRVDGASKAVSLFGSTMVSDPAPYLHLTTTTTNYSYSEFTNAGSHLRVGLENSSGGGIVPGSPAYSGFVEVVGPYPLLFGNNNAIRGQFAKSGEFSINSSTDADPTGTGAITAKGGIYAGKRIIATGDIIAGGTITGSGGALSGGPTGLTLNSSLLGEPIVFKLGNYEAARLSPAAGNLLIGGATDIPGTSGVKVFGATDSSSPASGALQVAGGAGIGESLSVGGNISTGGRLQVGSNAQFSGNISVLATTPSTSTATGAAVIAGGLGLAGDEYLGGALQLGAGSSVTSDGAGLGINAGANGRNITLATGGNGTVLATGALQVSGPITALAIDDSSSPTTGAIVVSGGIGIQRKAMLGDDLELVPSGAPNATIRLSGTRSPTSPGIWFADGGSAGPGNVALAGTANATELNAPPDGQIQIGIGGTPSVTLSASKLVLSSAALKVCDTTPSNSPQTGSATLAGGLGVAGQTSTGTLSVGSGTPVTHVVSSLQTLNFGIIAGNGATQDITVPLAGCTVGDAVNLVEADGTMGPAGLILHAMVSATGSVMIRATNTTSDPIDPPALRYRITALGF